MENNVLIVRIWEQEAGRIYWDKQQKRAVFAYHPDFIAANVDIAPLTASIHSKNAIVSGNKDKLYKGLPLFIADSLPDDWGNRVFANWIHERGLSAKTITPVDQLSFIGSRGMGALVFEPAQAQDDTDISLDLQSLYDLAKRMFNERQDVRFQPSESLTLQRLYTVGTSAGGKRPKALVAINEQTHEVRSGQLDWQAGFKYYILKFAESDQYPSAEIEMAYYLMAQEAGIRMMPSFLKETGGRKHFLTERFDRQAGQRIHTQTLAAMREGVDSYEELMQVARLLRITQQEQDELFVRTVFNMWSGNVDDHTKNFSFMLRQGEGESWHITPAYDITFTINPDGMRYQNRHELSVCGKVEDVTKADLLQFAANNSIKNPRAKIARVAEALSHWHQHADAAGVPSKWATLIEAYIKEQLH